MLCRKNGKAFDLSVDHKPDSPSERQRIVAAGGKVEFGRVMGRGGLGVARAFGDADFKLPFCAQHRNFRSFTFNADPVCVTPDFTETTLKSGDDYLLIACDGLVRH